MNFSRILLIFAALAAPLGVSSLALGQPSVDDSLWNVEETSRRLSELQEKLQRQGLQRVYIAGSSARAILDLAYRGMPLDMRDLDLIVVADRPVDREFSEQIGRSLDSNTLGRFSLQDLRPRPRPNPMLPPDQVLSHNAGWGFFLKKGDLVFDVSLFHSTQDLRNNGILDVDRILIPIEGGESLVRDILPRLKRVSYPEAIESNRVIDPDLGYAAWIRGRPSVVNWLEIERSPVLQSLRVIRGYSKAGVESLPPQVAERLRVMIRGDVRPIDSLQFSRSFLKALGDRTAAQQLKIAADLGALYRWSPVLHRVVSERTEGQLQALLSDPKPEQRLDVLLREIPFRDSFGLLHEMQSAPVAIPPAYVTSRVRETFDATVQELLGVSRASERVRLDELVRSSAVDVPFLKELDRVSRSHVISESERADLLIRAVLRRTPEPDRAETLRQLLLQASPERSARLLSSITQPRIGYFTGVVNPLHFGHQDLLTAAVDQMVLDKVIVIPTPKTQHNETPVDWEHRLNMARGGLGYVPEIEIIADSYRSVYERGGTRGVIEALRAVHKTAGGRPQWVHVMGEDSLERFIQKGYLDQSALDGEIVYVGVRPGMPRAVVPSAHRAQVIFDDVISPVYSEARRSSTIIRERLRRGESIDHLVPRPVAQYIRETGLYQELRPEEIHYRSYGSAQAEPLILIHGLDRTGASFEALADLLSARYRVIAYDQRGHGGTPARGGNFGSAVLARDLNELMGHLGIERAHVLGHSMGARTAVRFAEQYPDKVLSLVIEDMDMHPKEQASLERTLRVEQTAQELRMHFSKMSAPSREAVIKALEPLYGQATSAIVDPMIKPSPDGRVDVLHRLDVSVLYRHQAKNEDMRAAFSRVRAPILVVQADPNVRSAMSQEGVLFMKQVAPTTQFRTIAGAGHEIHRTHAAELADQVGQFLTQVSVGGRMKEAHAPSRGNRAVLEVSGAGKFAAAYLVKEAIKAVERWDREQLKVAALQLGTGRFWMDVGIFTIASRATETALGRGAGRLTQSAVPLAVGMMTVQLVHGEASIRDVAIDTASFLTAGAVVSSIADTLVYPLLFFAGPPRWVATGVYTVGKLALTLYGGEKVGEWVRWFFAERDRANDRRGVIQLLDRIKPFAINQQEGLFLSP